MGRGDFSVWRHRAAAGVDRAAPLEHELALGAPRGAGQRLVAQVGRRREEVVERPQPAGHRVGEQRGPLVLDLAEHQRAPDLALEPVAIDGKTLNGSEKQGASEAHLLSALSQRLAIALG